MTCWRGTFSTRYYKLARCGPPSMRPRRSPDSCPDGPQRALSRALCPWGFGTLRRSRTTNMIVLSLAEEEAKRVSTIRLVCCQIIFPALRSQNSCHVRSFALISLLNRPDLPHQNYLSKSTLLLVLHPLIPSWILSTRCCVQISLSIFGISTIHGEARILRSVPPSLTTDSVSLKNPVSTRLRNACAKEARVSFFAASSKANRSYSWQVSSFLRSEVEFFAGC